jgi:hypothetical protein
MGPQTNSNNFFGIAVSLPGINVNQASPSQMMYTNDYTTTTWRDSNGNITLQEGLLTSGDYGFSAVAANGTITLGSYTSANTGNASQGMQITDSSGFVLFELNGETWFWYDKTTNTNVMQIGLLPDGTYGLAIAKPGYNVSDGA